MIPRSPPQKRCRTEPISQDSPILGGGSGSNRQLVIYEDVSPTVKPLNSSHEPSDHLLCTYQCRQMVKSDFLDALSNAEKQVSDYQSKLEALNEGFCKAEAERKKFRDKFLYAEQELAAAKGREQVLQEQLLREVSDSGERLKKQLQSYSELEVKFQKELNLRKAAESSAASAEEKRSILEAKLSQLSETSEREKKCLRNELTQLKRDSKLSVSRISADNSNILVRHLQEELRNYESEVREARKLRSSHDNIELLKEKLLEEKSRRERAEAELSKLQELELSMKKMEDELLSWKLLLNDIPDVSSPDDILMKIAALQKEVIDGTMKTGETNARLKQMEVALDAAELAKQSAETEALLAKVKAEALKSEVKRIEKMLSLATEERDRLRNAVNGLKRSKNEEAEGEAVNGTRVQELEISLAKKESYIKDLENELTEQRDVNNHQHDEVKLLNERLSNETRRIKSLERESDRLRSEISLLEAKLGHGDYSAANTKVLRMINTLTVDNEAKQTIEALRTELQKTKEKLQAVEELKSQSGDAVKLVDSHISGKILQLKEQIATLEKREERYKTVFADRISVFRRACCELFGYKIVMDEHQRPNGIPVTRFTLQSIYAQSDDEKLEFEYESGNTNILVNEYFFQPEISRQVEIFIRKLNSIPAFTANLTMESFNRRTLS
ncbi:mitotic spindle checkpoint protein MAD1 [Carica papaya]|uniref:mitotic spindle checkpoint protein MAD1 n=1 Tax=Carica papaya TaxID=3649 RepID=UPI000B8D1821|nr:mitotic spindle checkpoint protein MAD1 [Carica papaya]